MLSLVKQAVRIRFQTLLASVQLALWEPSTRAPRCSPRARARARHAPSRVLYQPELFLVGRAGQGVIWPKGDPHAARAPPRAPSCPPTSVCGSAHSPACYTPSPPHSPPPPKVAVGFSSRADYVLPWECQPRKTGGGYEAGWEGRREGEGLSLHHAPCLHLCWSSCRCMIKRRDRDKCHTMLAARRVGSRMT